MYEMGIRLTIRYPSSSESTNAKHELLEGGNTSTNVRMGQLGLVQGDNHAKNTNTKAC